MDYDLKTWLHSGQLEPRSGENAHLSWRCHGKGMVEFTPRVASSQYLVLSAGIHGNETAPIELMYSFMVDLLTGKISLQQNVFIVFGNFDAMIAGRRFIAFDMNRLFLATARPELGAEYQRVAVIKDKVEQFIRKAGHQSCWHLDMHTAIRDSLKATFGVLPDHFVQVPKFYDFLSQCELHALVINSVPSGTFTSWTCHQLGAISCTLELGKALPFGKNHLDDFQAINQAIRALVCNDTRGVHCQKNVPLYSVKQVLIKQSDAFQFTQLTDTSPNFTPVDANQMIAIDGDKAHWNQGDKAYILFPNPKVAVGLRAGLLIAPCRT